MKNHSHSNALLVELLIVVLFFMLASTVLLQLFTAARTQSQRAEDLSEASAVDVLAALRAVTNDMDERQVSTGSRYLFITPTLRGVLDDLSLAVYVHVSFSGLSILTPCI
jgi:hypothetical protein